MAKIKERGRAVPRLAFTCSGESRTLQSSKEECDINNIMRKFEQTGTLEHRNKFEGRYGDFIGAPEYHEACNQVLEAQQMFMELPSAVRKAYDNDPAQFLAAVRDPEKRGELVELGLIEDKAEPDPKGSPQGANSEPEKPPEGAGALEAAKASQQSSQSVE